MTPCRFIRSIASNWWILAGLETEYSMAFIVISLVSSFIAFSKKCCYTIKRLCPYIKSMYFAPLLGLLGPNALSMNSTTAQNTLLNALNSTVSPLHSPSSAATSPTLWAASLANTSSAPGNMNLKLVSWSHYAFISKYILVQKVT